MGFPLSLFKREPDRATIDGKGKIRIDTLHAGGCSMCPLKEFHGDLKHPDMQPYGSETPDVYMLGEAPGETEDERGRPFVGKAGKVLRFRIPEDCSEKYQLRWNNCVRTRPPNNRDPTDVEIECCRPSIVRDIEQTKPKAIFGFGNVPLRWAVGQAGVTRWEGRRVPIQVGKHKCWFFPFVHPSYLARMRKYTPSDPDNYPSEPEFSFALALKRAFNSLDTLPEPIIHTIEQAQEGLEWVTGESPNAVKRIIAHLKSCKEGDIVGFDYETNRKRPYAAGAKILTVAIATREKSLAFPLEHNMACWQYDDYERVRSALADFLYKSKCRKVVHSLAFEMEWSAFFFGEDVLRAGKWGDSMAQAFILDERQGCLSLDFLCKQYFGFNLKEIDYLDRANLENAHVLDVLKYNALDAKYHRKLYIRQAVRLKEEGLTQVYQHQITRIPTFVLTQMQGVPFDQDVVKVFYDRFSKAADKTLAELHALPLAQKFKKLKGRDIKPWSAPDLKYVLQKMLKLDALSADLNTLKNVDHPIAALVLKWRKPSKLLGTYVKPVMAGSPLIYPDGLAHPVYKLTTTRTNRTSSDEPNIQNQPKREAREVRSMVRPGGNKKIVAFDYGQIQARNIAMESQDAALVKAFWDRYDIHTAWMERTIELCPKWGGGAKALADEKLRKKLRDRAKNEIVFPSFFGAQASSIARYLDVPEQVAQKIHKEFWAKFPDIKAWHEDIEKMYRKKGYVAGLSGFRRHAPISINQLINSPIQADEAMIVCDAMTRLSKLGLQASMEIHDDLTFIWDEREVEKNAKIVIGEMINVPFAWARNVPIVVEMSIGDDWASTKTVGAFSSDTWKDEFKPSELEELVGAWDDGTGWEDAEHAQRPPWEE